ncbi:MAG: nucleotidyltransferase domain-containing protein [Vicinamibacterales bacterium]
MSTYRFGPPATITAGMHPFYDVLVEAASKACQRHYGARLVSVAVFGSVGRRTPGPDSDIDLLVVAEQLPRGRLARSDDFAAVERSLNPQLTSAHAHGLHPTLSPIFKTPEEVAAGSPLFLDMLDDGRILYDRDGFLQQAFEAFADRLARLGARRIWREDSWYWDLKPDYKPGEVFEI